MKLQIRLQRFYCLLIASVLVCMIFSNPSQVYADRPGSYQYYIDEVNKSFKESNFKNILFYLEMAHLSDPSSEEPFTLIEKLPTYGFFHQGEDYYFNQGVKYYDKNNYQSALFYFTINQVIAPRREKSKRYIRKIKQARGRSSFVSTDAVRSQRLDDIEFNKASSKIKLTKHSKPKRKKIYQPIVEQKKPDSSNVKYPLEKSMPEKQKVSTSVTINVEVEQNQKPVLRDSFDRLKKEGQRRDENSNKKKYLEITLPGAGISPIYLDDQMKSLQPNVKIRMDVHSSFVLKGQKIKRMVMFNEGAFAIKRIDQNTIEIKANRRSKSFFHVWDDQGRWTFYLKSDIPESQRIKKKDVLDLEEYAPPFKFDYVNAWTGFYSGDSIPDMQRKGLNYMQLLSLSGESPYGKMEGFLQILQAENSSKVGRRSFSLTEGEIGRFKDFTVRLFDTTANFSTLSLPRRFFRGVLVDAYVFNRKAKYLVFRGEDQASVGVSTGGLQGIKDSFVEGFKMKYLPDEKSNYTFNYVRGFGPGKPSSRKDRVYSFQTRQEHGALIVDAELGYDEDVFAAIVNTRYKKEKYEIKSTFRDISKDYSTSIGRPSNRGEIGGELSADAKFDEWRLGSGLSVFRDREFFNPKNQNGINYTIRSFAERPLMAGLLFKTFVFYSDLEQIVSPSSNFRLGNTLSKTFKMIYNFPISIFVTSTLQRNRFELSPSSESDRFTLQSGMRMPIFKDLSYFMNYRYSWVKSVLSGEKGRPSVLTTGLSYNRAYSEKISSRLSINYSNEENAEGEFSFLSGTDIMRGSVGISYRPQDNVEVYFNGSLRNVWAETSSAKSFNDALVQVGLRSSWDTFFRWNPKAYFHGRVYKDANANDKYDEGEEGIEGITINVGNQKVKTNAVGYYAASRKAKKVIVSVDLESIPQGFQLISSLSNSFSIDHSDVFRIDFGFLTGARVVGLIFHDENNNSQYDPGETLFSKVKIFMDEELSSISDFNGRIDIVDVLPGEHSLSLDVNSLPKNFLPAGKIKQLLDVTEGKTYHFNVPLIKMKP